MVKLKNLVFILLMFFLPAMGMFAQKSHAGDQHRDDKVFVQTFFSKLYHYQFLSADSILKYSNLHRNHNPLSYILYSHFYWWKLVSGDNQPLNQKLCNMYLDSVLTALQAKKGKRSPEDLFYFVNVYAFKARLELFNGHLLSSLNYLSNIIYYLKESLKEDSQYEYFIITSGLYHYFVAEAIEKYPVVYPYFVFMPDADKQKGIALLKSCTTSENILIRTEALYFLMKINLEIEQNDMEAGHYIRQLTAAYSENLIYQYYYVKLFCERKDAASAVQQFQKLKQAAEKNKQLTSAQKKHFVKIANEDMKKAGI